MPDHFHAIVQIVGQNVAPHDRAGLLHFDRARLQSDLPHDPQKHGVAYRSPKSISSFIAGFKSSATTKINELRQLPGQKVWQARFNDRIIQDEDEYERIKLYIEKNPENWDEGGEL